jgi:hypothetical protein
MTLTELETATDRQLDTELAIRLYGWKTYIHDCGGWMRLLPEPCAGEQLTTLVPDGEVDRSKNWDMYVPTFTSDDSPRRLLLDTAKKTGERIDGWQLYVRVSSPARKIVIAVLRDLIEAASSTGEER